jgi:serine/threonine protein kinase
MEYCGGGDLLTRMHQCNISTDKDSSSSSPFLASEVLDSGKLKPILGNNANGLGLEGKEVVIGNALSEDNTRHIFKQLVDVVQYCHTLKIIHRDIKHKNILFDEKGNLKLIDFGLSNWSCQGNMSFCGTPAYASPEMLLGVPYMGPEVDVWSLGIVLYSTVTGKLPFTTVVDMVKGQYSLPSSLSPECRDLIQQCLQVEAAKRVTVDKIMEHPWMKSPPDNGKPAPC